MAWLEYRIPDGKAIAFNTDHVVTIEPGHESGTTMLTFISKAGAIVKGHYEHVLKAVKGER